LNRYLKYLILFLPVLFFIVGINFHRAKYANDPEYIYLVNAVAICMGESVGHIDNPGTTVMQLGAATIAATHLFNNPNNKTLVNHVLTDPDRYIEDIQNVLLFLNALIILLLGLIALKKTGSVWVALLLQLTSFFSANTLDHIWTKVSPEPLLFFITSLFIIALLFFYAEKENHKYKYIILFSLIVGAGLGTKATFLPLMIFPFFIFPRIKSKLIYLGGVIVSFVLFTIPAIPEYKSMYFWFRDLIRHTGKYGHGKKGLVDLNTYFPNIWKIVEANPIFGIVTFFSIVVLVFAFIRKRKQKTRESGRDLKILSGLVATSVFGILLVAKHFHANHYLLPELLLSGILLFFSLKNIPFDLLPEVIHRATLPVIVMALFIFLAWARPPQMEYADHGYKITNEEMDSTNLMIERDYPGYTKIYYYPYTLNKYSALNFGDVYTKRKLLPALKALYPDTYFYDFYYNLMQNWNAEIFLEDIVKFKGNKILVVGGPRDEQAAQEMGNRGIPLKQVYKGRIQAIYELDTIRYNKLVRQHFRVVLENIECDYETIDEPNHLYLGSNGKPFGKAFTQSDEEARSGKHSLKLDNKTEYAVEYYLDSLQLGCTYEVEVWRKADNYKGRLVVTANDAKIFYKSQNDFITSDNKGWDLLRIKFLVTKELENETLKIYLWNTGKETSYFDDFSIKKIIYTQEGRNP